MKKAFPVLIALGALFLITAISNAEEPAWFDMENCAFCKHLIENPDLLDNMTWEQYNISDGIVEVTMVKDEYKEAYHKAIKGIEQTAQEMAAGKQGLKMCGHCRYYGMMMMAGAKMETVEASVGDITLITSEDPETVKMIQEYAKKNKEEMAKMEASEEIE